MDSVSKVIGKAPALVKDTLGFSSNNVGKELSQGVILKQGWLRKKPLVSGYYWRRKYFVLTEYAEEGGLIMDAHSSESHQTTEANGVALPKASKLTPVVPVKQVRTGMNKKQDVFVFRVYIDHDDASRRILLTVAGNTQDEAESWRKCIDDAIKRMKTDVSDDLSPSNGASNQAASNGTQGNEAASTSSQELIDRGAEENQQMTQQQYHRSLITKSRRMSTTTAESTSRRDYSNPFYGKGISGSNWEVVDVADGIPILGEKEFKRDFPQLRTTLDVSASARDVLKMVLDDSRRKSDDSIESYKVVRNISPTAQIVYTKLKPHWVGALWVDPRDLIMVRYWRQDPVDEDPNNMMYTVVWQSVEDPEYSKPAEGYIRGKIFSMGFTIKPLTPSTCQLDASCHADPGGNLSWTPSSVIQGWIQPVMLNLLGIKQLIGEKAFHTTFAAEVKTEHHIVAPTPKVASPSVSVSEAASETENGESKKSSMSTESAKGTKMLSTMPLETWEATPEEETFNVRGKQYLVDGKKIPSSAHKFDLVAVNLDEVPEQTLHIATRSDSVTWQIKEKFSGRYQFIIQFMFGQYSMTLFFVAKPGVLDDGSVFAELFNDFIEGTDEYRDSRFKLIPRCVKGPWVLKKAVGNTPAILGKKLEQHYFAGSHYFELDINVNSSSIAESVLGLVKGYASSLAIDLCFLIEGQAEEELPEEIIGSFRIINPDLRRAKMVKPDPNPELTKQNREQFDKIRFDAPSKADFE